MSIKEFLLINKITLREMAVMCNVHYSTLYRLSIPKTHKSARKVSLDVAQRIVAGTNGLVTLIELARTA